MNSLFLDALNGRNHSRPPIWIMRQAGRYLPAYRELRSRYSFLELCHHPELITTITQMPIETFGLDAAILFSDILVIAETLGIKFSVEEGIGPIIHPPIQTPDHISALPKLSIQQTLPFVPQAIKALKESLTVPLIGFCGGPFTVASYLIEGKSTRDFKKTKQWLFKDPESFHHLLSIIADQTIDYLNVQIAAGVDAVQIFDSWAYVLGYNQFKEFSQAYLKRIMNGLTHKNIPVILFCRGASGFAHELSALQPSGISLDWNCDMGKMRGSIPLPIALQGNLDPDVLYGPIESIKKEATSLLKTMKNDPAFIVNLGHGIHPDTPVENVKALVECIKEWA